MHDVPLPFDQLEISQSYSTVLVYEKYGLIWKFRRLNTGKDKFIVNISFPDDRKIGYFTFYISHPPDSEAHLVFGGILISDDLRGRGMGNLAMSELFAFSERFQIPLHSAKPQGKPLVCAMLDGFGFAPHQIQGQDVVIVGRPPLSGQHVPIYFPSESKGVHFEQSRIARSGQYLVVDSIHAVVNGIRIVLNKRYFLQDEARAQEQVRRVISRIVGS